MPFCKDDEWVFAGLLCPVWSIPLILAISGKAVYNSIKSKEVEDNKSYGKTYVPVSPPSLPPPLSQPKFISFIINTIMTTAIIEQNKKNTVLPF